jgi:membrane protein YqaA with SNARE-associated domain
VILVSTRRNAWYEYAPVATVGSVVGAYITFRLAHKAGEAYLDSKFSETKAAALLLKVFKKRGTGTLIASTAIPFPFPTSLIFAATGPPNIAEVNFSRLSRRLRNGGEPRATGSQSTSVGRLQVIW